MFVIKGVPFDLTRMLLEPVSLDGTKRIDAGCCCVCVDFNGVSCRKFLPSTTRGNFFLFFLPFVICTMQDKAEWKIQLAYYIMLVQYTIDMQYTACDSVLRMLFIYWNYFWNI